MRSPRVLGHVIDPAQKARRLVILRELWLDEVPRSLIAARLSVDAQTVSWMARQAGLPMRKRTRGQAEEQRALRPPRKPKRPWAVHL